MIRKSLLDVLEGRKPSRRPVWFMRQAGRYLPEYREIRNKAGSFLDLCYQPELAAEVTLQPLRRYDLDAAIVFSDILVVPHAMGLDLRFEEGEGPLVGTVGTMAEVKALRPVAGTAQVNAVGETLGRVKEGLPKGVGLIGFCGGPWTVASYMVEGRSSDRRRAKLAAFNGEPWFAALIDRLVEESIAYLEVAEIDGVAAIGVETETPLDWLAGAVKGACAVQGNLDPVALLSGKTALRGAAADVARSVSMERHIFNLGHGITPETPPKALAIVLAAVRDFDSGGGT